MTEIDLFRHSSIRQLFAEAGLVSSLPTQRDVITLCKRYVLEQLRYIPGSSKMIDRYAIMAYDAFSRAIMEEQLNFTDDLPAILEKTIREKTTNEVCAQKRSRKSGLIDGLHQQQLSDLPPNSDLLSASLEHPYSWRPVLTKGCSQSDESFEEQTQYLTMCLQSVDNYVAGRATFIRHHLLTGPPGSGKTHIMTYVLAYAISRGLECCLTSLAAERASTFSGKHINGIFPFPVTPVMNVQHYVEHAMRKLIADPIKFQLLESLDVIFVEEVSMVSGELWAAMDLVLRHVMLSQVPFGGKLVICTGDFSQLPPPNGTLLILSSSILTNFLILRLKHFVRMTNLDGQQLLRLFDTVHASAGDVDTMIRIISRNCQFVETWNQANPSALRVFARRAAEREATSARILELQRSSIQHFFKFYAVDEVSATNSEQWVSATIWHTKRLDQMCSEPNELFAYVGAVMRLTQNKLQQNVFQGIYYTTIGCHYFMIDQPELCGVFRADVYC